MICMCADIACQMFGCRSRREIPRPNFIGYAQPVQNGRPHKCPICDGHGNKYNEDKSQVAKCNACENGIIWG